MRWIQMTFFICLASQLIIQLDNILNFKHPFLSGFQSVNQATICMNVIKGSEEECPGGGNSLHFVWYRRAAGIAPIFQVIYT